ncbi:hypothetical protein QUB56_03470 [Microcoleus sp. AR_TQ3_B6]
MSVFLLVSGKEEGRRKKEEGRRKREEGKFLILRLLGSSQRFAVFS